MDTDREFAGKSVLIEKSIVVGVHAFLNTETVPLEKFAVTNSGLLSPSRSALAISYGEPVAVTSTFGAKEPIVKGPSPPGNVTMNGTGEYAVRLLVVTATGCGLKPVGAVTVSSEAEAVVTEALELPNQTILFAGTVLKPEPLISTVLPVDPLEGLRPVMAGCAITKTGINSSRNKKKLPR
jgi:hypothetical protein